MDGNWLSSMHLLGFSLCSSYSGRLDFLDKETGAFGTCGILDEEIEASVIIPTEALRDGDRLSLPAS